MDIHVTNSIEETRLCRPIQSILLLCVLNPYIPFLHVRFSGSTVGHSDGSVLAVYPEHFWGYPLPADDLDGRYWRRLRLLHNRLHVLLNSE